MTDPQDWSARTRAAQALGRIDEATQGLVPPLHVTTTFIRDPAYADWSGRSTAGPTTRLCAKPKR